MAGKQRHAGVSAIKGFNMTHMKKILFLLLIIIESCAATGNSAREPDEDRLYVTRQYIGDFEGYRQTAPARPGDPHIIWIKTVQDSTYGRVSAYSRDCVFTSGERLYLRRKYVTPGIFGYWVYQVENDSSVFYRLREYQIGDKILVQSWY